MVLDVLTTKGSEEKDTIYLILPLKCRVCVSRAHGSSWQIEERSGDIMVRKCNCFVRWHQPENEKKVSGGVLPDWLPGIWSWISIQLRGKWRVCIFWTVKKIILRRQNSGCMVVYFNYSFQNYNYQMTSFYFLQIKGLSCWTWHNEKAKKFTRDTFCLSDNWICSDFFFFFWLAFNFFSRFNDLLCTYNHK